MLSPFDDAQLDKEACLDFLKGDYDFDLLPLIPDMMPLATAACVLGISLATLEKLVSLKQLPTVKPSGGTEKVRKTDLIKYIQSAFLCNEPVLITEISPNNTPK